MKYLNPRKLVVPPHARAGVTLAEVLVAMLIMGVGVVSVATIFPASVLRSIQASQLTNAAILSKNARARLLYDSTILSNANVNGFTATSASLDATARPDVGLIDPYGIYRGLGGTVAGLASLPRYSGVSTASNLNIESLGLLPDSWSLVRSDMVSSYASGSQQITLNAPAGEFNSILPRTFGNSLNPLYRIIMVDPTGRRVFRRTIRQVTSNTISWIDPTPNSVSEPSLNLYSTTDTPVRARIEVRESRYTWLLTVRKRATDSALANWTAEADLAVFFNRSFNAADEVSYSMSAVGAPGLDGQYGFANIDDDLDGTVDNNTESNWPGSDDERTLSYAGALPAGIKAGSFLLEANAAVWYRVVKIDTSSTTSTKILVDRNLEGASPYTIVTLKGIVQVFELGAFAGS